MPKRIAGKTHISERRERRPNGDIYIYDGVQRYFSSRAAHLNASPVLAFDSTTISIYSENQSDARRGFNKDGDGLNTIKLLTLYSVKDREPLAFAKQPGNVPDVISIENALTQLKCLNLENPLIVTDNG